MSSREIPLNNGALLKTGRNHLRYFYCEEGAFLVKLPPHPGQGKLLHCVRNDNVEVTKQLLLQSPKILILQSARHQTSQEEAAKEDVDQ